MPQTNDILHFWFTELTEKQHFAKDAALDALIAQRFGAVLEAGSRCELFGWRGSPAGRLAEIIVLDQFSRNVWRDTPRAFAQDALALVLAQELVARGDDAQLPVPQRRFAYMPYMHSESVVIHQEALRLFAQSGLENNLGVCRTWGVDSENRLERGQFLPDLPPHSPAMGQKAGEKWTALVDLQPTTPKSDRLLDFERRHLAILERFGRYPHRNAILGRASTPEELAFLQEPGAGF